MNYLVAASAFVTEAGMMPDIGKMTAGPYEWIVFDEPAGMLGLKLKAELAREAAQQRGGGYKPSGKIEIKATKRK